MQQIVKISYFFFTLLVAREKPTQKKKLGI